MGLERHNGLVAMNIGLYGADGVNRQLVHRTTPHLSRFLAGCFLAVFLCGSGGVDMFGCDAPSLLRGLVGSTLALDKLTTGRLCVWIVSASMLDRLLVTARQAFADRAAT